MNVSLEGCSDDELRSRLDSLAAEYHAIISVIAKESVKASHVRTCIQPLLDEIERRGLRD